MPKVISGVPRFTALSVGTRRVDTRIALVDSDLVTYFLLFLAVLVCWTASFRAGLIAIAASSIAGFMFGRIQLIGLLWILLSGLTIWNAVNPSFSKWVRWLSMSIFFVIGVAMSNHMLLGFNNLLVIDKVQFSFDSTPFTMYLNFDKTIVGIVIYLFLLKDNGITYWERAEVHITIKAWALLVALMLATALSIHYVRIDPKLPSQTWLWALNNLFFVCVAEESLFRGLIQGGLTKFISQSVPWRWLPLAISSLLFGLDHYEGGLTYILLAAIAGLFYGYTYWNTKNIETSIAVHFGFNLTHFLLFSYPSMRAS
jgi:membrane protease YdiL (CAAX protease family)